MHWNARSVLLTFAGMILLAACFSPILAVAQENPFIKAEPKPPGLMDFLLSGKYLTMVGLMVVGMVLLLGKWINRWIRITTMAVAFVLFGLDFFFPLHPSPMCAITNLFTFRVALGSFFPNFVVFALVIFGGSLLAKKLFCGWACPLGAFQELIHKIPLGKKIQNFHFGAFNAVRMGLLVLFFLTFFRVRSQVMDLGEKVQADTSAQIWKALSIYNVYDPVNMFELLHWSVDTTFVVLMSILVLASFFLYRPFCYLICPIGAISWIFEQVAPGRVRLDRQACTDCGVCVTKSPCPTIAPLLEGKTNFLPDCTSCGECIETCKPGAISFGMIPGRGAKS